MAELARLRAQLAEKEADHEETLRNHSFEMQQEGYQQLSDDANETLENTLNAISANADKQQEVVNMMLEQVKGNYRGAYSEINGIINETGTVVSDNTTKVVDQINTAINTVLTNAETKISATFNTIADSISKAVNTSSINVNNKQTQKIENTVKNTGAVTAINNAKAATKTTASSTPAIKTSDQVLSDAKKAAATVQQTQKVTQQVAKKEEKKEEEPALNGPVSGIKATLKKGAQNSNVKKLQKALNKLGYKASNGKKLQVDGVMGPLTVSSLKKFQKAMGVTQSGKLDLATKKAFAKKGYAKGILSTLDDELNFTHEGEIIRRSDGAILRQLPAGTQVIPKVESQNLLKWGALNPEDIFGNGLAGVGAVNNTMSVSNHYDSLITVQGNVDSNVMDRLEDLGKQLLNNRSFKNGTISMVTKEFQREWGKTGK